jgi:methylmalonyl-CoA/ethylmalonyl-CoA epimerase
VRETCGTAAVEQTLESRNGMKIRKITEVGIAVRDLEGAIKLLVELLGGKPGEIGTMEPYNIRYCMVRVGGIDFEVMEPIGDEGIIADFIKKKREGLHHVAFAVDEIMDGVETLKEKGVRFVTDDPVEMEGEMLDKNGVMFSGSGKFAFANPGSFLGVLFEFIEYPDGFEIP